MYSLSLTGGCCCSYSIHNPSNSPTFSSIMIRRSRGKLRFASFIFLSWWVPKSSAEIDTGSVWFAQRHLVQGSGKAPRPVENMLDKLSCRHLEIDCKCVHATGGVSSRRIVGLNWLWSLPRKQYLSSPPVLISIARACYDITWKKESCELKSRLK